MSETLSDLYQPDGSSGEDEGESEIAQHIEEFLS